jgi:hypothetical protein
VLPTALATDEAAVAEKNTEDDETSQDSGEKPAPKEAKPAEAKPAAAKPDAAKPAAAKPKSGAAAKAGAAAAKPATATAKPDDPAAKRRGVQPVAIHGPDSIIDRLQPYVKHIAIGALALFAVIGGVVGWRYLKRRSAAKDTAHVAQAIAISNTDVRPADAPPDFLGKVEGAPKFTTATEKAVAGADAMAAAGKVANTAGVYRAGLLMDAGKLDDAEALYRAHTSDAGTDGVMAREGLGFVLEARAAAAKDPAEADKLYHQALDAFKEEQPDETGPRRDFALYHQARMLVLLGKPADAKQALDAALKAVPESEIKQEIQQRLALLGGS